MCIDSQDFTNSTLNFVNEILKILDKKFKWKNGNSHNNRIFYANCNIEKSYSSFIFIILILTYKYWNGWNLLYKSKFIDKKNRAIICKVYVKYINKFNGVY